MGKGSSECPVQLGSTVDLASFLGLPTIRLSGKYAKMEVFLPIKNIDGGKGKPRNKATLDLRGTSDCELATRSESSLLSISGDIIL